MDSITTFSSIRPDAQGGRAIENMYMFQHPCLPCMCAHTLVAPQVVARAFSYCAHGSQYCSTPTDSSRYCRDLSGLWCWVDAHCME